MDDIGAGAIFYKRIDALNNNTASHKELDDVDADKNHSNINNVDGQDQDILEANSKVSSQTIIAEFNIKNNNSHN